MQFLNNFFLQVLPEFFQVEAFTKLNNAIGKVIEITVLKYIKTAIWILECFEEKPFLYPGFLPQPSRDLVDIADVLEFHKEILIDQQFLCLLEIQINLRNKVAERFIQGDYRL